MNVLNIYRVTNMTTETQEFYTFTCETITIETEDGQDTRIELFREKPEVEPVNDTERLITAMR